MRRNSLTLPDVQSVSCYQPYAASVNWDAAYGSRVKPIPFYECFLGREDRTLDATLATELKGILAWMVTGALAMV